MHHPPRHLHCQPGQHPEAAEDLQHQLVFLQGTGGGRKQGWGQVQAVRPGEALNTIRASRRGAGFADSDSSVAPRCHRHPSCRRPAAPEAGIGAVVALIPTHATSPTPPPHAPSHTQPLHPAPPPPLPPDQVKKLAPAGKQLAACNKGKAVLYGRLKGKTKALDACFANVAALSRKLM